MSGFYSKKSTQETKAIKEIGQEKKIHLSPKFRERKQNI